MTSIDIAALQIVTPMPRSHTASLLAGILFCTLSFLLAVRLKRSNNQKDKQLKEMRAALNGLQNCSAAKGNQIKDEPAVNIFDDNLRAAELTTRLQQPRLTMQQGCYIPAAPERYRYIQPMAEKGMNAHEIASMLSISLHEATQLVTLTRMARPQ